MAAPGKLNDINMLVPMLDEIRRRGFEFAGRLLHADRGYDAEYGSRMIFWMDMIPQHRATTGRHQPGHAQPEEGGQAVQPGRVSAEGPDRGRLWSRGEQEAPAALPVRPDGQPPAVRQGKGHRMERAGARPVLVGQQAEGTNPVIRRTTDACGVRLTFPACGRACSVIGSGDDGLTCESPGG